ncbi:MAG: hypothetical protein NT064_11130 [Proteobacteria bacterium]|nr:hypothetical protein [Pseudomonadota bacterium]
MSTRQQQTGMSMVIVLLALLLMALASVALLRSTDTATQVIGNLGFQKTALGQADGALKMAEDWISANSTGGALFSDDAAKGYYATSADNCDMTGNATPAISSDNVTWDGGSSPSGCTMVALAVTPDGLATGYSVAYVINRLCNAPGDPAAPLADDGFTPMTCAHANTETLSGSTRASASYGQTPLSGGTQYYYRITARILGPRSSVRYIQTLVIL